MKTAALTFDPSVLTAGQMSDLIAAENDGDMQTVAGYLAAACTGCPKAWGEPSDPATFAGMKQSVWNQVSAAWIAACRDATPDADTKRVLPEGVTVDFDAVLAADTMKLRAAIARGEIYGVADIMSRMITACPWGDAADPETYLGLSYFGEFIPLQRAVVSESVDGGKKEKNRSTSSSRARRI